MFNDLESGSTPTSNLDVDAFKKLYQDMRNKEREEEQQKLALENQQREQEKLRKQQEEQENEKLKKTTKVKEYTQRYVEQPREVRDNLMEYSDKVGVNRADIMEFAEQLATRTGKDLKDVSKFLVDNKSNSDLDLKIEAGYDEILSRFEKNMIEQNKGTPLQAEEQYDSSSAPRYTYTAPPTNLSEEVLNGIENINEEYSRKMENSYSGSDRANANNNRSFALQKLYNNLSSKLSLEAERMNLERQRREYEAKSKRFK